MEIVVRQLEPRKVVCIEHRGPYPGIGAAFGKLGEWIQETGAPTQEGIGIFYDDPSVTPAEELRSAAGCFVPGNFTADDPRVRVFEFAGGKYAVGTHLGSYSRLPACWEELMEWVCHGGLARAERPACEIYLNHPAATPESELKTEVCLAVE